MNYLRRLKFIMSIQIISDFLSTVSNFLSLAGTEEEGMVSILMRGGIQFLFSG